MGTATSLITAEELLAMPDDGYRYDLIEGELHKMWPAGFHHGKVGSYLYLAIGNFVLENDLGTVPLSETGFLLERDPDTVLAPDIAFVSKNREPEHTEEVYFVGHPDLAVEVVSPSNSIRELNFKAKKFLEHGTRLVWIIQPKKRALEIHRRDGSLTVLGPADSLSGEDVLPGFTFPLQRIFGSE